MSAYELLAPRKNWTNLVLNSIDTLSLSTNGSPITSGVYDPVITNILGLSNIGVSNQCRYIQLGKIVMLFGSFNATTGTVLSQCTFNVNLPPGTSYGSSVGQFGSLSALQLTTSYYNIGLRDVLAISSNTAQFRGALSPVGTTEPVTPITNVSFYYSLVFTTA